MIPVISTVEYLIGHFVSLLVEICDILSFILRHFLTEPEVSAAKLVHLFPDQVRKLSCFGVMLVVFRYPFALNTRILICLQVCQLNLIPQHADRQHCSAMYSLRFLTTLSVFLGFCILFVEIRPSYAMPIEGGENIS